ncbi:MAG TPA: type II toxin-antitoxin system VapC family toxin [Arachnia sp.]|nr:type II toxin-antitoxin system VapC family toxin [Arachnia sp.]
MTVSPIVYVDTSALGALLIEQPECCTGEWLDHTSSALVSCDLLETELRRVAVREGLDQADVMRMLDGVALAALPGRLSERWFPPMPYLRTVDALHLEAAMRLDADGMLTYDHRLGEAAGSIGLKVISPGVSAEASGST